MDRHRHDPQADPSQNVDEWPDDLEAGVSGPHDAAEAEQHALLVLLHDPQRQQRDDQQQDGRRDENDENDCHESASFEEVTEAFGVSYLALGDATESRRSRSELG
jgi:hypothetical protein